MMENWKEKAQQLEAERQHARDMALSYRTSWLLETGQLSQRIAQLEAENAELRKDRARLADELKRLIREDCDWSQETGDCVSTDKLVKLLKESGQ